MITAKLALTLSACIIISTVTSVAEAQTVTADEMIAKSSCTSFDCYSEFISKNGFTFDTAYTNEHGENYSFIADQFFEHKNSTLRTKNRSTLTLSKSGKITSVKFSTADKVY